MVTQILLHLAQNVLFDSILMVFKTDLILSVLGSNMPTIELTMVRNYITGLLLLISALKVLIIFLNCIKKLLKVKCR